MTSDQRQELIIKKMKSKGIELGSGVPIKKYDSEEFMSNFAMLIAFLKLREKGK